MGDVPFAPRFGRDLRHAWVGEYPSVEELHDVEWGANDVHVFAEDDGLGYRHLPVCGGRWVCVVLVQRPEHGVLALDLVRGLGEELACGLLAEHESFLAAYAVSWMAYRVNKIYDVPRIREEVCGVRLQPQSHPVRREHDTLNARSPARTTRGLPYEHI